MRQPTGFYPRLRADAGGAAVVSQAGAVVLVETIRRLGLDRELSAATARWRRPRAVHDPGKVVMDLAVTLALGGDCLADIAVLRAEPGLFGPVASDPTVSRVIDALAKDADGALAAIDSARANVRARAWRAAGRHAPDHGTDAARPLVLDIDATLVSAHSDKEGAAATFKRGYGFHPLTVFADHGPEGTGEPLGMLLRKGNAGSNTAADHIDVLRKSLRQLPSYRSGTRPGRRVLVRTDAAGCTHEFLDWVVGQRLSYSVGFTLPSDFGTQLAKLPAAAWTEAYEADGSIREGAWVAEATGLLDLDGWPKGMRVILRKERPHPGAQLRLTDVDGHRITAFATNTAAGGAGTQLPDLELRHRRRARAEDRIRCAKDTGLRNLPLHDFNQNRIWLAIVALAADLLAWTATLALAGTPARRWEPKRLRLRLLSMAGRLTHRARRAHLHLPGHAPWAPLLITALDRLHGLAPIT